MIGNLNITNVCSEVRGEQEYKEDESKLQAAVTEKSLHMGVSVVMSIAEEALKKQLVVIKGIKDKAREGEGQQDVIIKTRRKRMRDELVQ